MKQCKRKGQIVDQPAPFEYIYRLLLKAESNIKFQI
jgi:hypothetical protein